MTNLNAFLKLPTEFQKKCLIYPPTINEVVGNPNFDKYHSLLCLTQEDIEDALNKDSDKMLDSYPTPFEFLMANASRNSELAQLTREAFYFFIKEDVTLLYEQKIIIIGDLEQELSDGIKIEQLRMISTEEDFFAFQNAIRAALGEDAAEPPDPNLHPKARAMKAKARYRDRIKAKNKQGIDFFTQISSICCMGIGITPLNIGEMSYAAVSDIIQRYQLKEKYENDLKLIGAGADAKKLKVEYWIEKIN